MSSLFKWAWNKVYWAYRSFVWRYPLFKSCPEWMMPYPPDGPHFQRIMKSWEFLRPFFAGHGYYLYERRSPLQFETYALPLPKAAKAEDLHYPYGRRFYDTDEECLFLVGSMYVWAARDTQGRDVVIKLVSDANPSQQLKALQYLNSDALRSDPRNHTIHVVDFLTFEGLVFAVMPRWDDAFVSAFENVQQIMDCAEAFLEGLEFLHEHRIYHGDILAQNCGMNTIGIPHDFGRTGRRDAATTRYAFFDFEGALLFSRDVPLQDVEAYGYIGFEFDCLPARDEPFNPFPVDVFRLGNAMERHHRHIENLVPELGPFFDRMKDKDFRKRPTAEQALADFRAIRSRLTSAELAQTFQSCYWEKGKITYSDGPE